MKDQDTINALYANTEQWDNGELGTKESSIRVETEDDYNELQNLLNQNKTQLISIRLPKTLIADLKSIGTDEGLGYQTLAKEVLKRFVDSENRKKYNDVISKNKRLAEELKLMEDKNLELMAAQSQKKCS